MEKRDNKTGKYREILVLSIVPCAVGILILVSWAMAHWEIGPYFLNAGLALFATLFGGYLRFVSGFKDIFNRKITVNVLLQLLLLLPLPLVNFGQQQLLYSLWQLPVPWKPILLIRLAEVSGTCWT